MQNQMPASDGGKAFRNLGKKQTAFETMQSERQEKNESLQTQNVSAGKI